MKRSRISGMAVWASLGLLGAGGVAASADTIRASSETATGAAGGGPSSGARDAAGPWSSWKRLRFEARQMLIFAGHVQMDRRDRTGKEVLETETRATLFGAELAHSRTMTRLDPSTGEPVEFYELSGKRGRRYTFGPDGYSVEKLRPKNSPDAPVEKWESYSRSQFPYPASDAPGTPRVFDYYGMLLYLKRAKLRQPGDEIVLYVATSHGPEPYRIRVSEARRSERTFEDLSTGETKTVPVRELRLRVSPAKPGQDDEGFMKMEGETEIWVEADTRTLLEIDGKIRKVPGRVEIQLAAIG